MAKRKIGILTGGGDVPGLNVAIKSVVMRARNQDIEIVGQTSSKWSMPYERGLDVSIARRPKITVHDAWPRLRMYI